MTFDASRPRRVVRRSFSPTAAPCAQGREFLFGSPDAPLGQQALAALNELKSGEEARDDAALLALRRGQFALQALVLGVRPRPEPLPFLLAFGVEAGTRVVGGDVLTLERGTASTADRALSASAIQVSAVLSRTLVVVKG